MIRHVWASMWIGLYAGCAAVCAAWTWWEWCMYHRHHGVPYAAVQRPQRVRVDGR